MKIINSLAIMGQKLNTFALLAAVAGLWLAVPGTLHAQNLVLEKVSLSATIYEQNTNSADNEVTFTTKAPTKVSFTTASLLKQLAADENTEGNWTGLTFPAGASLEFNGTGFEVDKGTNELVDVSDILTWTQSGANDIGTGSYSDANGAGSAPFNQTDYFLVTIAYDDSGSTGELAFTVTGLATVTGKATNPNVKTGKYNQSGTVSFLDGTGEGTISSNNVPFVMTGFTITASGSVAENDGEGTNP